ncbi:hypothetical protein [Marispirochaeta aestuarii]|uniref:hypothetical protein n=1 Tax=Marispirochaeta aestuarii TaxID=1963862 RepID=UPI001177CD0E|nr:hypothetical protein [Marispirochaeta aestuarii]
MNAKAATFQILDAYKPGERFTGFDLYLKVKWMLNETHYPDTYLRYVRDYRKKTGRIIRNVNKHKSIYEVIT